MGNERAGREVTEAAAGHGDGDQVVTAELLLRPERRANAFEETVRRLLHSIRLGLVQPGSRLPPERELASMTGVSRDTVRDAIGALSDAGYLVARRGRHGGTFVVDRLPDPRSFLSAEGGMPAEPSLIAEAAVTPEQIRDVLLTRRVMETGIARAAAEAELSRGDRDRLWQAHRACVTAPPEDYRRRDSRLHVLFAELTGSATLLELAADARMRVNDLLDRIPVLTPNLEHANQQHERIVRAILFGQPGEAQAAMSEHLDGTEALLRGFLS